MVVRQRYQGGNLIISRQQLAKLGVVAGDVVEIGKVVDKETTEAEMMTNEERRARLSTFLQAWQAEWADVDWEAFEAEREVMWAKWTMPNLS